MLPVDPARHAVYCHLLSIYRDVRVGLWNCIQQLARGGRVSVVSACSLRGDNDGTIHTIAASPHESPMAIEACSRACLNASMIA